MLLRGSEKTELGMLTSSASMLVMDWRLSLLRSGNGGATKESQRQSLQRYHKSKAMKKFLCEIYVVAAMKELCPLAASY